MAIELEQTVAARNVSGQGVREIFARLRPAHGISDKEQMFFTERLALLLETGSNLHAALKALRVQAVKPAMVSLLDALINDVGGGKRFSQALAAHPESFDRTYVNLVAASEDGGFMHEVLEQLLEMEKKRLELKRTLVAALSYPIFLTLFATGVVVFVLVMVFPRFADMFASIHDQLPGTTLFFMAASDTLRLHWPYVLAGLAAVGIGLRYWVATEAGRTLVDRAKLGLPGIRSIFVQLYLQQSLRVMSLSLGNGVSVVDTLSACREVVNNRLFRRFIQSVELKVQEGSGLARTFVDADFIPPMAAQMITTGEESSSLPKVMGRLSDYYEQQLAEQMKVFARVVEPLLLVLMGAVIGLIVSSLLLPIFKLSHAVG